MENRKKDHIELAIRSKVNPEEIDQRFYYEPLFSAHPVKPDLSLNFLGKQMRYPIWVSSMTGGTSEAASINMNLAQACKEFGLGMGLGSCRKILNSNHFFEDFNLRPILGNSVPFYANLGINQIADLLDNSKIDLVYQLVDRLFADGLIIHVNPLQEWFQPEGDRLKRPAISILEELLQNVNFPIIVKEVGQGMGPASLSALLKLPLAAIEFAAFGGTNFTKLEMQRNVNNNSLSVFYKVGHTADEMLQFVIDYLTVNTAKCNSLIISGGINNSLHGYYLINKSPLQAVFGMAGAFLQPARKSYDSLREFISQQIEVLELSNSFLRPRI
jgi:isopentenyl-diphosphate delta-isomerase